MEIEPILIGYMASPWKHSRLFYYRKKKMWKEEENYTIKEGNTRKSWVDNYENWYFNWKSLGKVRIVIAKIYSQK